MHSLQMKQIAAAAALGLAGAAASAAVAVINTAPTVSFSIDGENTIFIEPARGDSDKVVWVIDNFMTNDVSLSAFMDPDPIITSAVSVLDFGAASNFNFSWALPIVPTIGPVTLKLTIGGSCTDNDNNGCSATPNLASGFLADGLLDSVLHVSGGSSFSGAAGGSGSFASSTFIINLPAGPYNNLGMKLGFLGSGGGDAISFTLGVEVVNATVPEPGSLALVALAVGAAGLASRRSKKA